MKQFNYLQAIYMSFYSRALYRDVVRNWGAGVILYLLLVLFILWSVLMIRIQPPISRGYQHFAENFFPQIPKLSIKNGEVKTPENKPYFIKDPDSQEVVAIIDTTGEHQILENKSINVLVTKTTIIYRGDNDEVKTKTLSPKINLEIHPMEIDSLVGKFVGWLWILLLPFCLVVSLIYRLFQAVIYAIFGKIFAKIFGVPLVYEEILKLAIVAVTPALVLGTIFDCFGIRFNYQLTLYFVLAMGYLIYGLKANK